MVWLAGRDSPLRRLGRSLCLGLTAIPALAWVLFTWKVTNANATRGPNPFLEDIERFSHGIANWFVSSDTINEHPSLFFLLPWVVCSSLVFFLLLVGWRWRVFNHNSMPVMGLGVVYLVFLFASARLKYVNRLVGRFTLPIYIPLILLFLLTILVFLRYVHQHGNKNLYRSAVAMCIGAFMFVNAPLMAQTRTILADSYAHGVADPNNIFNSDKANNHSVIKFWKSYPPPEDSLVFANSPAYLAFQTWEVVRASPVKYLGPYGNELLPLGNYYPDLFQPGKVTYLVWIGPPTHDYIYTPDELGQVLHLETLFENRDGGVYIITPQKK